MYLYKRKSILLLLWSSTSPSTSSCPWCWARSENYIFQKVYPRGMNSVNDGTLIYISIYLGGKAYSCCYGAAHHLQRVPAPGAGQGRDLRTPAQPLHTGSYTSSYYTLYCNFKSNVALWQKTELQGGSISFFYWILLKLKLFNFRAFSTATMPLSILQQHLGSPRPPTDSATLSCHRP